MVSYYLLLFMLKNETSTIETNFVPFLHFRQDHLRSTSGIICGSIWGSFPAWGSFAVGDHLRRWRSLLFSLIVNDIKLVALNNSMVKYADHIIVTVPVRRNSDTALAAVNNLESWSANNRMPLNLSKRWKTLLHNRTTNWSLLFPQCLGLSGLKVKEWLKV